MESSEATPSTPPPVEHIAHNQGNFLQRAGHQVVKFTKTMGNVLSTFCSETHQQINKTTTIREKVITGSLAVGIVATQVADRFRAPESINIPLGIRTAENHGNLAGAAMLGVGIYTTQFVIGSAWGLGLRRFKNTTDVFDNAYPAYKESLAEEKAGYLRTLVRQGLFGLGMGNTAFVAAEVMNGNEASSRDVVKMAEKTSHRIGITAFGVGYGVLEAAQHNSERYLLQWSVPDVVNRLEQPLTWVAFGVAAEGLTQVISYGVSEIRSRRQ